MEQLTLEICRVKLQEAFDSNDRGVMVNALQYVTSSLPFSVAYDGFEETRLIFYANGKRACKMSIDQLDFISAKWNIQGYMIAIDKEFARAKFYSSNYSGASERLFVGDRAFEKKDVLYRRDGNELSVDGLLKVCGYAVKLAQVVEPDNKLYDKSSAAVSVFKGLEFVLNNEGKDRKCAKMLHLANDFLVEVVKPSLVSNGAKSALVGMSLLVDLAIEFFVG